MARKSLTGQLNMFDLWKNLDDSPMGEVEMVSLMPWDEPESEVVPKQFEKTPQVEGELQLEEAPHVEETPQLEEAPQVEETPQLEEASHVEETPQLEEAPQVEEEPQVEKMPLVEETERDLRVRSQGTERPAMQRLYQVDGKQVVIAYINYNKVQITREGQEPEIKIFENSKDAVDYYVQKMHEFEPEE